MRADWDSVGSFKATLLWIIMNCDVVLYNANNILDAASEVSRFCFLFVDIPSRRTLYGRFRIIDDWLIAWGEGREIK